jgi:putative hemolysin
VSGTFVELLVIVLLVLLNGVFVAAEIALVTVRRSRLDQLEDEGNRGAERVRRLIEDPGRFLAVIQLGITFIGFLASAFAAVSLVTTLTDALTGIGVAEAYAAPISLVLVTILLSLFTIVFGELVPKSLALAHPDRFALALARPVDILGRLLGPVVAVLTSVTNAIAHALGAEVTREARISAEELKLIVERGGQQGILEAEEEQMIHAVIELGDRRLHEVLVPRTDMIALPVDATYEQAIDTIVGEGHSRIPVYEGTVDEIVGLLYAKDLLPILKAGVDERPALRSLLRPPVFVPESMTIDDLLHEFQRRKVHIAIVLDEYGGTAGMVTIEDLLEEIVGEIQDEYDTEEPMVVRLSDDEARIDGRASIDDLGETFDVELELEDEDEYDTVGGLIFHRLGDVPEPGDVVRIDDLVLTVESTDGRRVGKVLVVRVREGDDPRRGDDDR